MHIKSNKESHTVKNIKDLSNLFFHLEEKYKLIDLKIDDVLVWQCIRYKLFILIATKIFNLGPAHERQSSLARKIITSIMNGVRSPSIFEEPHDIVIFPHTRTSLVDGKYIDIYTYYLEQDLISKDKDFCVLQRAGNDKKAYNTPVGENSKYLDDIIILSRLLKIFIRPKMSQINEITYLLSNEIKKLFNIDIDLKRLFKNTIKDFKASYILYAKLFKKIRPKQIYIVVSYEYPSLVKAAKDFGVEVIELQHGAISKYHLGYSYGLVRSIDYFPDKFLAWNEFWKNINALPLAKEDISIYPFKYQINTIRNYKYINQIKNQVVVISQGTITDQLAKIILDNFDFFKDKNIKYKLHPGEYTSYKRSYHLTQLLKKENIELVKNNNIYDLFASSEYQVGAYSTAIFEGIEFGLKTILCSTMFSEYMEELIESKKVYMILHAKK